MSILETLDVGDRIKVAAKKLKLNSYESVLYLTNPVGALSTDDVKVLKLAVSKQIWKGPHKTGLQLKEEEDRQGPYRLTTGCQVLDQALRGGILCHGITEISGESASGKTQFGLQLSLTAQLPKDYGGLDNGTLYICTEDAFPSKRLYQMIQNFTSRHGKKICNHGNLGDKIYIEHVSDFEGLMECLGKKADLLLKLASIKLIVLDSVAAHFRSDYESYEMYKRAQHINALGSLLFKYSHQYHIPVVCINQVTSSMNTEGRQLVPSLGLAWSNNVTTRIMLARTGQTVTIQQDSAKGPLETVVREMEIVFAPHLPSMTVPYVIDHEGMKGFS